MTRVTLDRVSYRFDNNPRSLAELAGFTSEGDPATLDQTAPNDQQRTWSLSDINLMIQQGETVSLLGPSGCGKSTLLKVISGIYSPTRGTVYYDNVPLDETDPRERGIGMVFQNYALYPHLDSRSNIGFFDIVRKQPDKVDDRIKHVAEVMGVSIKHLLSRRPPTLSGGEKQRVAMARALARDPKLFLFDEPLSNLDAKLRTETRVQLKRLLQHYGITAVYVTHDQTEAIALSHRMVLMRSGEIVQVGDYNALYYRPNTRFVAEFFGHPSMNLFEGQIERQRWEGQHFAVEPVPINRDSRIWLGIRAEDVVVGEGGIEGEVEYVEPLFAERVSLVTANIQGESCTARVPIEREMAIGMRVRFRFPVDKLYFFDPQTEQRVHPA